MARKNLMGRNTPEYCEVYEPSTPRAAPADYRIPFAEARGRVNRKEARFMDHLRAIKMFRPSAPPYSLGESLTPGAGFISRFDDNSPTHREIIRSWATGHLRCGPGPETQAPRSVPNA